MFRAIYAFIATTSTTTDIHELNQEIGALEHQIQIDIAAQGYSNLNAELKELYKKRTYKVAQEFAIQLGVSARRGWFF